MLHVPGSQDLANARYYGRGGQPLRAPKFRGAVWGMLHVPGLQDLANARYYGRGGQPLRAPKFRGAV
jgi:hypothetical protein